MHLDRRQFLEGAATASLLGCVGAPALPRDKTNLLVIMTDQQRWDAMSCGGNSILHTPNMDRLAAQGVLFTDATCAAPLCGPSRAAMLTGRLAFQHGCRGNFMIKRKGGIREDVRTYDEVLKAAGYTCSYHGKWHTGAGHRECYEDGLPYYMDGYREDLGELVNAPDGWKGEDYRRDRYTKLTYRKVAVDDMMRGARQQRVPMPHHNEAGLSYLDADHSLTAWTANQAIAFLASKPKTPFSVTCSILAPHAPLIASKPFFDKFDPAKMPMPTNVEDDLPPRAVGRCVPKAIKLNADGLGRYISLYYGLVAEADAWVGRILDALEASGQEENTLVVFLADHGELMGSHGTVSKMQLFEEALRVPMILRLPGRVPKGKKISAPATGFDLFPTVLDLCGVPHDAEGLAGRSLRGAWERPDEWPDYAFAEMGAPGRRRHQFSVRNKEWKLILPVKMQPRLYHLGEDPGEQTNLLKKKNLTPRHTKRASEMREALRAGFQSLGDPFAEKLPKVD
jgi:arylsulfatase A-like enzyme